MNLKESNYEIEIENEKISGIEEKMLFSGMCDFTLPMTYTTDGLYKTIRYNCQGFMSVRDIKRNSVKKVMEIFEKTLQTLSKSIEFYILPEKVTLTADTVFYNPKTKQVKIAYVPSDEETVSDKVIGYLREIASDAEDMDEIVHCIEEELKLYDENLMHMARYIHEQRRRLLKCIETDRGNIKWS